MNPKSLALLAAVTALAVAAAYFAIGRETGASRSITGEKELFPELSDKINDVVEMSITKSGQVSTLVRDGGAWTCREADGYRADFDKVRSTLLTLARIEIVEPMTKDPARLAKLGLDDASGTHVALRDASGASVAEIIVGDTQYARNGQQVYARRAGEDQAYRCEADLAPSADPLTWVDRAVLKLDSSRPSRIEIVHADGERVTASRSAPSDPNWKVAEVPGDRGLKSEGIANAMGTALSYLSFDEVKKADELPLGTSHAATARFSTFDDLSIEVRVARIDGASWITLGVAYEAPPEPPPQVGPAAPEAAEGAEGASVAETPDSARAKQLAAEAAELDAHLQGWAYRIPQYKADLFLRRMSDLLSPETGAEPPGGAGAGLPLEDADAALQAAIEALQPGEPPAATETAPPPAETLPADAPGSDAPSDGDGGDGGGDDGR